MAESDHPDRARRVMSLVRQMRGGKDYDAQWGSRMRGEGPIADLMSARFKAARRRYGLEAPRLATDISAFRVPPRTGDQVDLFGKEPQQAPRHRSAPSVGFAATSPVGTLRHSHNVEYGCTFPSPLVGEGGPRERLG